MSPNEPSGPEASQWAGGLSLTVCRCDIGLCASRWVGGAGRSTEPESTPKNCGMGARDSSSGKGEEPNARKGSFQHGQRVFFELKRK